jgi:hypothetical protein
VSIEDIDCIINQLFKNPPPNACPLNEFRDIHNLLHEGINPCRLKMGKDLLEIDMVQVFGPIRGRSGYSFANVHNDKVLDRMEELYPIVYGKSFLPKSKLLGKDFSKGIMAKLVKGILISWANFSHESNTNQWGKWHSKLDILNAKKASLLGSYVLQVKR